MFKSKYNITLSFILIVSMLLASFLFTGFTLDSAADLPPPETIEATEKATMLEEDITKRAENERHFKNSDGSYTAIQYSNPVNFMQNGKWEAIDNELTLSRDGTYRNTNAPTDVRLSQNLAGGFAEIKSDGYTLSWQMLSQPDLAQIYDSAIPASRVSTPMEMIAQADAALPAAINAEARAQVKAEPFELTAEDAKIYATRSSSQLEYKNAVSGDNIDAVYTVQPYGLK